MSAHAAPRVAEPTGLEGPAIAMALLVAFSPLAMLSAIAGAFVVSRERRWHWWQLAAAGAGVSLAAWLVVALGVDDVGRGVLLWQLQGTWGLLHGHWVTGARTAFLGLPVGATFGAVAIGIQEHKAGGAEWHPLVIRRREVVEHRQASRRREVLERDDFGPAALGIHLDGELPGWVEGPHVVVPPSFRALGAAFIGGSGSGKTVGVLRFAGARAHHGSKVAFADCKGTDPELAERIVRATAKPGARVALWPDEPWDMWRGNVSSIASKLSAVVATSHEYYGAVAKTMIRLAVGSPQGLPRSSDQFLERLSLDYLATVYRGDKAKKALLDLLIAHPKDITGVVMDFHRFFDTLAGRFDGRTSFEDVDVCVFTAPSLEAKDDADAAMRILLADYRHYAAARKSREGEDSLLVVDEFSALEGASPIVATIAERVRDVGGQVVVTAQSWQGLGADDDERKRLRNAIAALFLMGTWDPEELVTVAGSVRSAEQSWQLDDAGATGMGSVRMGHRHAVDPDKVRSAETGDCWVIRRGGWVQLRFAPPA